MTQTLEERIAEFKQIYTGLPKPKDALEIIIELQAENQALLAKNGELLAENKIWQEMVDSTNQTNQALIKRLQENKNDK